MPEMGYDVRSTNDKSNLVDGWCPAFLLQITDEATPETWKMYQNSPRMWRWHVAVWPVLQAIGTQAPERQSAPSSQKFTPKGTQRASKAYTWTCELLGRQVQPGERVNLDPLLPLPCRVKIERNGEYANLVDMEKWPDGQQYLTPEFKAQLAAFLSSPPPPQAPPAAPAPQPVQPAAAPVAPAMASWGKPATGTPQPGAAPTKPAGWGR